MEGLGVIDRQFWKGKRVLVTGHTGFKGAWLALWLEKLGAVVTGFSVGIPTEPSLHKALGEEGTISDLRGDIRDAEALSKALAESKPEIVFHLAAQSLVRLSYQDPLGTLATNVMGTANVLESVRKSPSVCAVINVTSDKCYDNREQHHAYREGDPLGGRDPYSCSKGCAELVTTAYRLSFFSTDEVGIASVRAGNVIGGGDWSADRLVSDCMRAFSAGKEVVIRNPGSVRPWQHVLEALRGYLLLCQRLCAEPARFSGAFNFGPNIEDSRPVSFVVDQLCRGWGSGASFRIEKSEGLHEASLLQLDSSHAQTALGWRPLLELPEALAWTANWYKSFYNGESMRARSLESLDRMERMEKGIP